MERKEINAILVDDFETFLKEQGLFEKFVSGQLLCDMCGKPITSENIACIFYSDEYRFCCDSPTCLERL